MWTYAQSLTCAKCPPAKSILSTTPPFKDCGRIFDSPLATATSSLVELFSYRTRSLYRHSFNTIMTDLDKTTSLVAMSDNARYHDCLHDGTDAAKGKIGETKAAMGFLSVSITLLRRGSRLTNTAGGPGISCHTRPLWRYGVANLDDFSIRDHCCLIRRCETPTSISRVKPYHIIHGEPVPMYLRVSIEKTVLQTKLRLAQPKMLLLVEFWFGAGGRRTTSHASEIFLQLTLIGRASALRRCKA